jgi:hypothetical protein
MNQFEINNGLLGVGNYIIIKLIGIIAKKGYEEFHDKNDEWDCDRIDGHYYKTYYFHPMKYIPNKIKKIIYLSGETSKLKNNWFFKETIEKVNLFDFLYPYE